MSVEEKMGVCAEFLRKLKKKVRRGPDKGVVVSCDSQKVDAGSREGFSDTGVVSLPKAEVEPEVTVSVDARSAKRVGKIRRKKLAFDRSGTVAVLAIAMVAFGLISMRLLGYNVYTVMSGSMEPNYPVGSVIYVKPVDYRALEVGDVISFVSDSSNTVVTHRIVDIETNREDATELRFRTQGDANKVMDGQPVYYKNVLGTPVAVIPGLGYIVFYLQRPPGIYVALVLGTLLLVWAFKPETFKRKRRRAVVKAEAI